MSNKTGSYIYGFGEFSLELWQEKKRIKRKALRFASRNQFLKKSVFPIDLGNHPGVSLI